MTRGHQIQQEGADEIPQQPLRHMGLRDRTVCCLFDDVSLFPQDQHSLRFSKHFGSARVSFGDVH